MNILSVIFVWIEPRHDFTGPAQRQKSLVVTDN